MINFVYGFLVWLATGAGFIYYDDGQTVYCIKAEFNNKVPKGG